MKNTILIADDSALNRSLLKELLQGKYEILEAKDGEECVELFSEHEFDVALVLLDVVMPRLDGLQTLEIMKRNGWVKTTPIIMISGDNTVSSMERALSMGAHDYVVRPFDASLVLRRVENAISLYRRQDKLLDQLVAQMKEREGNNALMVSILSEIVEFRNGESNMHVVHIRKMVEILLRHMMEMEGNPYELDEKQIEMISMASVLHDIGKMAIPDAILNKPGRYTPQEFAIMKTHTTKGAEMIEQLSENRHDELLKVAYQVCRWHHERYDGQGYPDGLIGEQIPLSAQVVGLSDVYDALTSKRVYKDAYTHETAINMIFHGECGAFNPDLLRGLIACEREIQVKLSGASIIAPNEKKMRGDFLDVADSEALDREAAFSMRAEQMKESVDFLSKHFEGLVLDYRFDSDILRLSGSWCEAGEETYFRPGMNEDVPPSLRTLLSDAEAHFVANNGSEAALDLDYFGRKCSAFVHAGRRGEFAPPTSLLFLISEKKD